MKKAIICFAILFGMLMSAAACDSGNSNETAKTDKASESVSENSSESLSENSSESLSESSSESLSESSSETVKETEETESESEDVTEPEEPEDPRLSKDYAPVFYLGYFDLYNLMKDGIYGDQPGATGYDEVNLIKNENEKYINVVTWADYPNSKEAFIYPISSTTNVGPVIAIKYRTQTQGIGSFQIYLDSASSTPAASNYTSESISTDGEWHLIILDLKKRIASFNGETARFFRFDFFNATQLPKNCSIDFEYIAFFNSVTDANKFEYGDDWEEEKIVYIDPSSGYTESTLGYGSCLDMINGMGENGADAYSFRGGNSSMGIDIFPYNGETLDGANLVFSGWSVVEGGVKKYVWSVDGGKTWHDASLFRKTEIVAGQDAHVTTAADRIGNGYKFADPQASKVNVIYQCSAGAGADAQGLAACLTDHIGKTVNVTFAAVPVKDEKTLCLLYHIIGVKVVDKATDDKEPEEENIPQIDPSECQSHSASESWYAVVGQAKEQKICVKCGTPVETRNIAFAYSADYIEHTAGAQIKGPWGKQAGTVDGSSAIPRSGSLDIILGGWLGCNGGYSKLVYSVNGGEWKDCGNQPGASSVIGSDVIAAIEAYKLGIKDYKSPGRFRVTAQLGDYKGQTVTVRFGVVPKNNAEVVITFVEVTNVKVPN